MGATAHPKSHIKDRCSNLSAPAVFMRLYYLRALYRICREQRHFCPYFHFTLLISFLSILHVGR